MFRLQFGFQNHTSDMEVSLVSTKDRSSTKILVIGIAQDLRVRADFEDEMAAQMRVRHPDNSWQRDPAAPRPQRET